MKSKILCLLLLIPIIFVLIAFTASSVVKLPIEAVVENIILEHEAKEAVLLNKPYKLYAHKVPKIAEGEIKWSTSDEEVAYVENGYLYSKKEGIIDVYASLEDGSLLKSFKAYIFAESDTPRYIMVNNSLDTKNGISNDYYYGGYEYKNNELVPTTLKLDITVIPYNTPQEVDITFSNDNVSVDKNNEIVIEEDGLVTVTVTSKVDSSIYDTYTFNAVRDGVNIYSYEDLLNATTRSKNGEIAVMQTSLESKENAYLDDDVLLPNTKLIGIGDGKHKRFEYDTFESTYDTTYLKNNNQNTELKMAINIKKDIYGNGFTINLHDMAYPSKVENGTNKPVTSKADLFQGPLAFVNVAGFVISGQDNIGFAVTKSDVTIQNINLRNCNFVEDLTYLDYTGTVLEIMDGANNCVLKDSIVSNGRTVVRTFSNKDLLIDNCFLQYAREFILKIGSNTVLKPEQGQLLPTGDKALYSFLSPFPEKDENGEYQSDSSCTIKDTFFYKSGFFSIGFDTHFAGQLLYNGIYASLNMTSAGVYNLCGTSLPSTLTLEGDVRLYDWKKVSELDSSSLIKVTLPDLDVNKYFDVAQMIKNKIDEYPEANLYYDLGDDIAVHGGIAFFGGGRNLSKVIFKEEAMGSKFENIAAPINDPAFGSGGSVLLRAAGYGEFKFYLYTTVDSNNLYGETPNIDELKR